MSHREPGGDGDPNGTSPGHFRDDKKARELVFAYEQTEMKRIPEHTDAGQPGYDIRSVDPSDGSVHFIEIKGLGGSFTGFATVNLSRRQFDDANRLEGTWWLYVVEDLATDAPRIIPIPNPSMAARSFYLTADDWRPIPTGQKLPGSDD